MVVQSEGTLAERVHQLEKRVERQRAAVVVLLVTVVAIAAGGAASVPQEVTVQDEVRARRFVLVQADGVERGAMEVLNHGQARIVLHNGDQSKGPSAFLSSGKGSAGFMLTTNTADNRTIILSVKTDESIEQTARELDTTFGQLFGQGLRPTDRGASSVAEISVRSAMRLFRARDGTSGIEVDTGADGGRLALGVDPGGQPSVRLGYGATDRAVLGHTTLVKPASGTTESRSASSLVLFGPDGTVLEKLPR